MRKLYLVGYDVASGKRRRRIRQCVRAYAVGHQKSVYECWMHPGQVRALRWHLAECMDRDKDRIFVIELDPRAVMQTLGKGEAPADGHLFYAG